MRGFAISMALAVLALAGPDKNRQPPAAEPAAIIVVSVFREPGFALPGADLQLAPADTGKPPSKVKKLKGSTSARGEFVFHVPPAPMHYTLSVSAKGLKPLDKAVFINGGERVDVTFMLEPESK